MALEGPLVGDELWNPGSSAVAGIGIHHHTGAEECVRETSPRFDRSVSTTRRE